MSTPKQSAKQSSPSLAPSSDRALRANRTRVRDKKRNRTKYHKSAQTKAARAAQKRSRSKPLPYRLLVPEKQLRPQDIPAAKVLVLEQICDHGSPTRACLAAGVGRRAFYNWLHEPDKVFAKEYARARGIWRASMIGDVESSFGEKAQLRDTLAGIFLLKHNTKRYREVSRVQLSGPDGGPIVTLDAKEELMRRLEQMVARQDKKPLLATAAGGEVRQLAGSTGSEKLRVVRAGSDDQEESEGLRRVKRGRRV